MGLMKKLSFAKSDIERGTPGLIRQLGQLRASKEVTEIGCLLMLHGLCEIIQPLTWVAGLINAQGVGGTVTEGLPFGTLFGYMCCIVLGILAVLIGYAAAFHNGAGSASLSNGANIFVQTAYILTVTTCMKVTRVASEGGSFVEGLPLEDEPNTKLLAAMGVLMIISMWFGMLGSISVLLGSLAKFQLGLGHERDGRYYGSRLAFYSWVLWLGGFAQTVIGVHLLRLHGAGPISDDGTSFYKVAMLVVTYPSMSIAVGVLQMMNGIWGILKRYGLLVPAQDGGAFATSIWTGWLIQLVIQVIVQPSILPGAVAARFPPELAAFAFGMNFMPAYLDAKSNSLPNEIEPEYFGQESLDDEAEGGMGHTDEQAPEFSEPGFTQ